MRASSGWSLRLRLLFSVGLVLLPPAFLSVLQGISIARRDVSDFRAQLIATARAAAAPEENVLASAREITLALANLPAIRTGAEGCSADLAGALTNVPFLLDVKRLDAGGLVVCAADARSVGLNIARLPVWPSLPVQQGFVIFGRSQSLVTDRPAIEGFLPYRDAAGRFQGALNVTIDIGWLNEILRNSALPKGSVMAVFDRRHNLIAATDAPTARALFSSAPIGHHAIAGTVRHKLANDWTFATTPLLGPEIYVGLAMPEMQILGEAYLHAALDFVLPFVMILLTWLAIWIVTDRQLVRWIIYLRRVSAAYRGGKYSLRPNLSGAPSEFKSLGEDLAEMAAAISVRDRSLRDAVAQKTLLIKEIHHRVKNNLQVVMSLMSLQAKRRKDPGADATLAEMRTRINALALVHRILYEIDDENTVDMKRLLEQLAIQTAEGFGADRRDVRVVANILQREVPSELAVTLSLFTVEAMTNAFKHAFPARGGTIWVVLEEDGAGCLRLAVEDDGVGFDDRDGLTSIGSRLMKTFGQQARGTTEIRSQRGMGSIVELIFPDPRAKTPEKTIAFASG